VDKAELHRQVIEQLHAELARAEQAALTAHETATHAENVAENKYDTLGLEAAYLASGQARRVAQLQQTLMTWRQLRPRPFDSDQGIQLGALVQTVDEHNREQWLFLGPPGASMKLQHAGEQVQVLGSTAPLGLALLGKRPGDEVSLQVGAAGSSLEVLSAL
jgi:transcription elongation GreA/GreB family factor